MVFTFVGLADAAIDVIGARVGGASYESEDVGSEKEGGRGRAGGEGGLLALTGAVLIIVLAFFTFERSAILLFCRDEAGRCGWPPMPKDVLLRLLTHFLGPRARNAGMFSSPGATAHRAHPTKRLPLFARAQTPLVTTTRLSPTACPLPILPLARG